MNPFQRLAARLFGIKVGIDISPRNSVPDPNMAKLFAVLAGGTEPGAIEEVAPGVFVRTVKFPDPPAAETQPVRPGIKPAPDPADGMTWATWRKCMDEIAFEGWAPCQFANRQGQNEMGMVFGIAWQDFGIYRQPMHVCGDDGDETIIACLTYLPSGLGFGVFDNVAVAARAAVLGQPILAGMNVEDSEAGHRDWMARKDRLFQTWRFHGIEEHPERHVHRENGFLEVWHQVPIAEQPKPQVNA